MTTEEMIRFVEQDLRYAEMDVPHNVPKYEAIIASLRRLERLERAGRRMYGELTPGNAVIRINEKTGGQLAWDAAVKGE